MTRPATTKKSQLHAMKRNEEVHCNGKQSCLCSPHHLKARQVSHTGWKQAPESLRYARDRRIFGIIITRYATEGLKWFISDL